jgi:hypothetical protein
MANLILVDYDNIEDYDRRVGLHYVIEKIVTKISPSEVPGKHILVRLYGGWYENNRLTTLAQTLATQIAGIFPTVLVLSDRTTQIIVNVEMAYSLISQPNKHLFHTFRRRTMPSGLGCYNPSTLSCSDKNCPLLTTYDFFKKDMCGLCKKIKPHDLFFKNEQKLVDTMLTSDLIFSAKTNNPIAIVSSDDDFWPGILTALAYGISVTQIHTKGQGTNSYYLGMATRNYIQRNL